MNYKNINSYEASLIKSFNKNSGKEILQYAVGALLYMPATNTKIADKILKRKIPDVKSMVFCLEDSIGDNMVTEAENCVKSTLVKLYNAIKKRDLSIDELPLIFIRVREPGQMTRISKKCGKTLSVITGFVIPKFDQENAKSYVEEFKKISDDIKEPLYMMPILESRSVISKTTRIQNLSYINDCIKSISDDILCIRVGGTDFCNYFGIRRSINTTIWEVNVIADCISDIINVFGTDYVVSAPTWEYFENKNNKEDRTWLDGLNKELQYDRLNGLIGKTAIHPTQISYIQKSLIVSEDDYNNAIQILSMSVQRYVGVKKDVKGNQMNECKTHINWAKKIVALAGIYGLKKD